MFTNIESRIIQLWNIKFNINLKIKFYFFLI